MRAIENTLGRFCKIAALLFTLISGYHDTCNSMEEKYFKVKTTHTDVSGTSVNASSKLQCAKSCTNDIRCSTFSYNKRDKTCETSDKIIFGQMKDTYIKSSRRLCLTTNGYSLWIFPDMAICIRYSLSGVNNNQDAKSKCDQDKAHLLWVENDSMRLHIVDILQQLGTPSDEYVYIDGYDALGNDQFVNWKGQKMTWIPWDSGNPDGGNDDCMRARWHDDFRFRDDECYRSRDNFLCQIDV